MQANQQTTINRLISYHMNEDHLPKGSEVFRKEMVLLILGLGGLNYVPVAYQNGHTFAMSVMNAITTAILGEVVLYTSGDIYYKIKLQPQYVDSSLQDIIQAPLTQKEFVWEVAIQGVFAAASAVPLATTLFDADLEIFNENPALFWSAFSYIEVVNTAMHLVPIELTMRDEVYGFLPLLLTRCWRWITHYQVQEREKQLKLRALALAEINPLLANAKENFLNKLVLENNTEIQTKLQRYKDSPSNFLVDMLACYSVAPELNSYARITARVLGALVVSLACLGYAANPYLVFKNYFHFSIKDANAITAMPIYFFMELMAFFGDGMGVRLLQDILSLRDILCGRATLQEKLPIEAKLYPKTFTLLIGINLFGVVLNGAPGREMMKTAFEKWFAAWLIIIMMAIVDIGIGMLAWYVPLDFTKMMLSYYAQYQGDGVVRNVAITKAKMEALIRDFNRIKPEYTEELKSHIRLLLPSIEGQKESEPPIEVKSFGYCWPCSYFYSERIISIEERDVKNPLLRTETIFK